MATGADKYWVLGLPVPSLVGNPAVKYWVQGHPVLLVDIAAPLNITVPVATLTTATFAPRPSIPVEAATLAVTTYAPTVGTNIPVPVATVAITTYAPAIVISIPVPVGSLGLTTYAPDIEGDIEVPLASMAITGYAPSIGVVIEVPVVALGLTTYAPNIGLIIPIPIPVATLGFTTYAPIISDVEIPIPRRTMALTGYAPAVGGVTNLPIPVGVLHITTYAPTLFIGSLDACAERFGPKLYYWEPSYLVRPEDTFLRATDWDNAGYQGMKFVQGIIIEADTEGETREILLQGDQADIETLTINHNGQIMKPYSLNQPVQKHLLRLLPTDLTAHWRLFNVRWVYEPAPEFAREWKTQGTDHDIQGYQFLKDGYIAHNSTADITLNILVDDQTFTYTIPNSGGEYVKTYILFSILNSGRTLKGSLFTYELTSSAPFQLFQKDSEVRVHAWAGGGYQVKLPFGDISRKAGARI